MEAVNTILLIGALLAFAGAVIALWLVREHQTEREQPELITTRDQELEAIAA